MKLTEQSAKVLAEIDHKITLAIGFSDLLLFKSLRCLKTAIEGLLEILPETEKDEVVATVYASLAAIIAQWNENK